MAENKILQSQYRGWIYKWTNYLKGYQKRWFVLQNGLLSYYRNQAEMAHTCRGTINLANAYIHTEDSCTFVISNAGTQTFHLKATSEVERQKWVTALELAKAEAIKMLESAADSEEDDTSQPDKNELQNVLRVLSAKLEDLNTCNDMIAKHGSALQRALAEVEQFDGATDAGSKVKSVNERATLFRITSNAMINACREYLDVAQSQGRKWQRSLQIEHDQRLKLEEMVEQLAKDQAFLEKRACKSMHINPNPGENPGGSEEDDFFDAEEFPEENSEFTVSLPSQTEKTHKRTVSSASIDVSLDGSSESDVEERLIEATVITKKTDSPKRNDVPDSAKVQYKRNNSHEKLKSRTSDSQTMGDRNDRSNPSSLVPKKHRRKTIPPRPNYSLNLWSIMKNCIGKELSKIPMPINFNEPLSMLQRLSEDLEYSECLHRAARCEDSTEQLTWVAAFTVSAYSTTITRSTKPFNPLLGETFEADRMDDLGWRTVCEQVSHHPPTAATYTEGRGWTLWQEFTMTSKFRGKYLQIIPTGIAHLFFEKSKNHYTWRKVSTIVHNIIVGKLWVDNYGEMYINNHKTGDKCHLKYAQYSYFSRETPRKVTGVITDSNNKAKWVLTGHWDSQIETAKVLNVDDANKNKPVFETGPHKVLWKRNALPHLPYNFSQLAAELNEIEEGVAPTDSRLRPDQRLMEEGSWDEANKVKILIEDKQRNARRQREALIEKAAAEGREPPTYEPAWFKRIKDPVTGHLIHTFTGSYWQCKDKKEWKACPDIFL